MLTLWLSAALAMPDVVFQHPTLIDENGVRTVDALVVEDGRITHVGSYDGEARRFVNARGRTITPGFIDAHVHLANVPGAPFRDALDDGEFETITRHHLKSYVANGITTVVDVGMPAHRAVQIDRMLDNAVSPRVVFVGPFLSPADGYPSVAEPLIPGLEHPDEVGPTIDAFAVDTFGVKVTWEHGMSKRTWPVHTEAMAATIANEAASRGKEVWVHAQTESQQRAALLTHPDVFVHPTATRPGRAHLQMLLDKEIAVVSTISAVDLQLGAWEPDRLEHPMVVATVPEEQRDTASSRDVIRQSNQETLEILMPRSPGFVRSIGKALMPAVYRGRRAGVSKSVHRLVEAGVPLLMGSDSGNWPVFLYGFHGTTSTAELVLLHRAGLTPVEVVTAATSAPAKVLEIEDEVGRIAVGMRAELVVFDADLMADFEAVRSPKWVMKDGVLRTPAEWMVSKPDPVGPVESAVATR